MTLLQLDDLSSMRYDVRDDSKLQEMNATSWARRQFMTWHLLYNGAGSSIKPFDGFDKMILLSWVIRKLSYPENQLFTLHYWDLMLANILIDENDNIV